MESLTTTKRLPACSLALLLSCCARETEAMPGGSFLTEAEAAAAGAAAEAPSVAVVARDTSTPRPAEELARVEALPGPETRLIAAASNDALRVVGDLLPGLQVLANVSSDRGAIELVLVGRVEAAFVARPLSSNEQFSGAYEQILGWQVPVLVVHPSNPVRSLSRCDLREVLAARVTSWARLGGPLSKIVLVVPSPGEVADRYAALLMPGDRFAKNARGIDSAAGRLEACAADPAAIAVADLADVETRSDVKFLALDGMPPSGPAVAERKYPAGCAIRVVWKRRTARVESLLRELKSEAWIAHAAGRLTL